MANITRNFMSGKMNKVADQRIVPNGEYIDAMNIRMGSTEQSEIGVLENTKGNTALTSLTYTDGTPLSIDAVCIGAIADSANQEIYWFVHDPNFPLGDTGRLDMIVSFNVGTGILTYHVISIDDGTGIQTTLNFNPKYLITGVDLIEDLLFFTDDYNAPRFINIKRSYSNPVANIDQFSAESLLVIKKPPVQSPGIEPFVTNGQENYMEERFICFAYRYKYADGEYSATSQWSAPAFVPNVFNLSTNSYLNEGMTNFCNACNITYNTGGPLVVGVDLLFKQMNTGIIKVIEKLNKADLGLADNTDYTYVFSNSKIFTVLPESELLRLYDNVPRFAKAQTIMGNRLMYGNYVEGYNLVDKDGRPLSLDYYTTLVTEEIGESVITPSFDSGTYTIDTPTTVPLCVLQIPLTGLQLVQGALLSFDVILTHADFSGTVTPTETTDNFSVSFSFFLPQDYASVYEMATSIQFQEVIGTSLPGGNIQPVYPPSGSSCLGTTFTDLVNCQIPNTLTITAAPFAVTKYASGISAEGQGIEIITSPGSDVIQLKFNAMRFVDNLTTPTVSAYEYYSIVSADVVFQEIANPRSLHSNRDYEIGIVYMDDFLRSSTALVSLNNTEHVPCGNADTKNSIQVIIPTTQIAPEWATRYKFVIKPSQENYETIYSSIFFLDPDTNSVYFLLEGENARKVEQGDRLIVKADSNGPTQSCVYATVLEKQTQASGFISPVSGAVPPAGVYMKINPNEFSAVEDPDATISPGTYTVDAFNGAPPLMRYPTNIYRGAGYDPINPLWEYEDYTIPSGSQIKISVTTQRLGPGGGDRICEKRVYIFERTFTSSANYNNFKDWWDGDNIGAVIGDGTSVVGGSNCPVDNEYIPTLAASDNDIYYNICKNYWRFYRDPITNKLILMISATYSCTGGSTSRRKSTIIANIEVFRSENTFIFETEPSDALPDIFYENDESFEIDSNGQHMGNVQNQNFGLNQPAVINTGFFNCYTFGNGAEGYKIRDSIVGRPMNLGNRVTAVSAQDYKAADRFADITYSGIYNTESNLNKLNEFNAGLLNYKYLEVSFGEIYKMDGRETDVLVLQEDKISYVLAGKNLLSDSAAGSAITSVPEVLGTQIARTEKYGISFNPESYVQWGYDRYFTDAKRGAVIQLKGNSYSNEQLGVVSEFGMRTWFRDVFNASFNTQKLGGFDPYMNEYVLCATDRELPINPECLDCGTSQVFTLSTIDDEPKAMTYCVDLHSLVGEVELVWNVITIEDGAEFSISVDYNGNIFDTGTTSTSGDIVFDKDINYIDTATVTITYVGDMVLNVLVNCPTPQTIRIVEIVVTNDFDSGKTIHTEYRYENGAYVSPLQSNLTTFVSGAANPLISRYNMVTGYAGAGGFPPDGSTITIRSNKILFDTYNFDDTTDKFKYHRDTILYTNTPSEMNNLLSIATNATPILGGPDLYYANFATPPSSEGEYLYLIWDLRDSIATQLCYSPDSRHDVCCECAPCSTEECIFLEIYSPSGETIIEFPDGECGSSASTTLTIPEGTTETICINDQTYIITSGNPVINILACNDCSACKEHCETYEISNIVGVSAWVLYRDCFTNQKISREFTGLTEICVRKGSVPILYDGFCDIILSNDCGCCSFAPCSTWVLTNTGVGDATVSYEDCDGNPQSVTFTGTIERCGNIDVYPTIVSGTVTITTNCDCLT